MNGGRRSRQSKQATGQAEQQAFKNGFANYYAGSSAQRQANGVLAPPADGPYEHQTGDVYAGNQEHNRHSYKQGAQQWSDVCNGVLAQWSHISANVNC